MSVNALTFDMLKCVYDGDGSCVVDDRMSLSITRMLLNWKAIKMGIAQRKSFLSSSNIAHIYILLVANGEPTVFFTFLLLRHSDTSWERFTQVCKFAFFFFFFILLQMFALIFAFQFETAFQQRTGLRVTQFGKGKFDVLDSYILYMREGVLCRTGNG